MTFLEIVLPLIGLAWIGVLYGRRPGTVISEVERHQPALVGSELDVPEPDPFTELDVAWLAEHQIGGWLN